MLKRLALWLCRVAHIPATETIAAQRLKGGTDAVERGQRWELFYREEGGLLDMLEGLRREAFEAAAELDPSDTDKIYYWATADRNIRRLQQKVEQVIVTGKVNVAETEQAERNARLR
ncbi:MAG: hypothetical protein ACRCYS_14100, partial [Beijerinckiaceae bacterium]